MSMLMSLVHHHARIPVHFIHAARNSRHHAFADEVRCLAARCPHIQSHVCYDAPLHDDVLHNRCDSTGLLDKKLLSQLLPATNVEVFLCGPKPFMFGVLRCLKTLGVADSLIHYEFFGPRQELSIATSKPQNSKRSVRRAAE